MGVSLPTIRPCWPTLMVCLPKGKGKGRAEERSGGEGREKGWSERLRKEGREKLKGRGAPFFFSCPDPRLAKQRWPDCEIRVLSIGTGTAEYTVDKKCKTVCTDSVFKNYFFLGERNAVRRLGHC
jgi:hypothetical protein